MAAAMVIYGGTSAAVVGATATVHKIVEEKETQVEFAPPPEPEPPPPPPPPPPPQASPQEANARPRVKRPELVTPTKISDEKLAESSKPLAPAGESGPVDGFLDGVPGGTGTAPGASRPAPPPPPKPEPLILPVESRANGKPRYSPAAKRKGIEGTVVVAFDVLEDGTVANARIVSGPAELQESVLRIVPSWRYQPAHRGTEKVRYRMKKSIVFRLEDT